jgi:hypothetical protein
MGAAAASPSICWQAFARLVPFHQTATTRPFDTGAYADALPQWENPLLVLPVFARAQIDEALAKGSLSSPEALFALLDGLSPRSENTYRSQLIAIAGGGTRIEWRNYRFPYGWTTEDRLERGGGTLRPVRGTARRGWAGPQLRFPFFHHGTRRLVIGYPEVAPRTPDELLHLAFSYSSALASYRLKQVGARSGLLSLPFGRTSWSFPYQAMQVLYESEAHLYNQLSTLRDLYPEAELPLPEKDKVWRWRYPQLGIELLTRIWFPSYQPFGKMRPNNRDWDAFFVDQITGLDRYAPILRAELERRYRARLELNWVVDRWRNFLTGMILIGLGDTAWSLYDVIAHDGLEKLYQKWNHEFDRYQPEKVNHALEHYHQDPDGFDVVNDFYNSQIQELRDQIASKGDPDGKLAHQIHVLEQRRDYMKN